MKKLFAVALLGTIALTPVLAHSQGMRSGHGGEAFKAQMLERFKAADENGDESLTRAEIYQSHGKRAAEIDTNDDGVIGVEEIDAARKEMRLKRQQRMLNRMDTDGDGVVSTDEFARSGTMRMQHMDHDRDGVVTLDEATTPPMQKRGMHHGKRFGGMSAGKMECPR
ncbi:EF-hand domain-containing protein [Nisaea denitrificans]|uniref:EF-hand domain-containing protein n=1 Tax=Nisaea denitrificans TaxID=390877 RepID=UPI000408D30A|nr:EF-hand domain-containing protein [Nisaea denitrificans]